MPSFRSRLAARHTSADWTDPDVLSRFPRLAEASANEVILRAGEMLYVPENWIHAVINIGVSAQCNRYVCLLLGDEQIDSRLLAFLSSVLRCCTELAIMASYSSAVIGQQGDLGIPCRFAS